MGIAKRHSSRSFTEVHFRLHSNIVERERKRESSVYTKRIERNEWTQGDNDDQHERSRRLRRDENTNNIYVMQ